jgi:hypothetical protein
MRFAIRDDDTCYFTRPEELDRAYRWLPASVPVSLAVTPFAVQSFHLGDPVKFYQSGPPQPLEANHPDGSGDSSVFRFQSSRSENALVGARSCGGLCPRGNRLPATPSGGGRLDDTDRRSPYGHPAKRRAYAAFANSTSGSSIICFVASILNQSRALRAVIAAIGTSGAS